MRGVAPRVVSSRSDLRAARAELLGQTVALVPTMGALHEGHRALMTRARELADAVVVSVFVNPLQFGPGEDLDRYPRPFSADLEVCADEQVSLVWAPDVATMYPAGSPLVSVSSGPLGAVLEGAVRPGHFDGVLTVVAKLVGQVRARRARHGTQGRAAAGAGEPHGGRPRSAGPRRGRRDRARRRRARRVLAQRLPVRSRSSGGTGVGRSDARSVGCRAGRPAGRTRCRSRRARCPARAHRSTIWSSSIPTPSLRQRRMPVVSCSSSWRGASGRRIWSTT